MNARVLSSPGVPGAEVGSEDGAGGDEVECCEIVLAIVDPDDFSCRKARESKVGDAEEVEKKESCDGTGIPFESRIRDEELWRLSYSE